MRNFKLFAFAMVMLTIILSCSHNNDSVFQWRGNQRMGIYDERGLLKSWPDEGLKLLWETEIIGNGYGSPVFTNEGFYIMGETDSIGYLFFFNHNGDLLWKKPYGHEWMVNYVGSHSSPTIVGDKVYLSSGLGDLYCLSAKDGEIIWELKLKTDFHGRLTRFGHSESPLILNDLVFFTPGGADTNVVALDRFTGKIKWFNNGKEYIPGYNSPNLLKFGNKNILLTFTAYAFLGIDAETGKLLWSHEQTNVPIADRQPGFGDTHSNTAIFDNEDIYYVAGDGNGAVKLKLLNGGDSIMQVWNTQGIYNYMGGIVKIDNFIYGSGKNNLVSINATNGMIVDSLKIGDGALVAADNMFYYYNQRGEVHLVKYCEGKMSQISWMKISKGTKEHFAHPVIHNGILYIRHGNTLQAYDIRSKG